MVNQSATPMSCFDISKVFSIPALFFRFEYCTKCILNRQSLQSVMLPSPHRDSFPSCIPPCFLNFRLVELHPVLQSIRWSFSSHSPHVLPRPLVKAALQDHPIPCKHLMRTREFMQSLQSPSSTPHVEKIGEPFYPLFARQ